MCVLCVCVYLCVCVFVCVCVCVCLCVPHPVAPLFNSLITLLISVGSLSGPEFVYLKKKKRQCDIDPHTVHFRSNDTLMLFLPPHI